jgi:hypothetical protein
MCACQKNNSSHLKKQVGGRLLKNRPIKQEESATALALHATTSRVHSLPPPLLMPAALSSSAAAAADFRTHLPPLPASDRTFAMPTTVTNPLLARVVQLDQFQSSMSSPAASVVAPTSSASSSSSFREHTALHLLAKHEFSAFRSYLNNNRIDHKLCQPLYVRFEIYRAMSFMYEYYQADTYFAPASHPEPAQSVCFPRQFVRAAAHTPGLSIDVPLSSYLNSNPNRLQLAEPQGTSVVAVRQVSAQDFLSFAEIEPLLSNMFTELSRADPPLYLTFRFVQVTLGMYRNNNLTMAGVPMSEVCRKTIAFHFRNN